MRDRGEFNPKTSSIAVPILADGPVLGSLCRARCAGLGVDDLDTPHRHEHRNALDECAEPLREIASRRAGTLPD